MADGPIRVLKSIKLRMPENRFMGVRLCEISLIVKRETAQIYS